MKNARRARATKVVRHFIDEIVRADKPIFLSSLALPQTISPPPLGQSCLCKYQIGNFKWQMFTSFYFRLGAIHLCWLQVFYYYWPMLTRCRVKIFITASYLVVTLICQICANPNANHGCRICSCAVLKSSVQCVFMNNCTNMCVQEQLYTRVFKNYCTIAQWVCQDRWSLYNCTIVHLYWVVASRRLCLR